MAKDTLAQETDSVVATVIRYRLNDCRMPDKLPANCEETHLVRLCELTARVENDHGELFESMFAELALTETTAYSKFTDMTEKLFSGGVRWSRIVTLLAFGSFVCWKCKEKGEEGLVQSFEAWLKKFFRARLLDWIASSGGWVSFITKDLCLLVLVCLFVCSVRSCIRPCSFLWQFEHQAMQNRQESRDSQSPGRLRFASLDSESSDSQSKVRVFEGAARSFKQHRGTSNMKPRRRKVRKGVVTRCRSAFGSRRGADRK